jgi:hypothetical protein
MNVEIGRTIPFLGIHKWDFRCSADTVHCVQPVIWSWCKPRCLEQPLCIMYEYIWCSILNLPPLVNLGYKKKSRRFGF